MEAPPAFPAVPFDPPILTNALRKVPVQVINEDGSISSETAFLMEDSINPSQCYLRWPKAPIKLEGRGEVLFCQVLLRDHRENDARILFKRSETTVAVKKLRRRVIDAALQRQAQGGPVVNENPYTEIRVMQLYGDYEHIMRCYEALWDTNYIYIVTLYARERDLHSNVYPGLGGGYITRERVPEVVRRLVENLQYLQERNLVHRDLKPENTIHHWPWMPFIDFAMTLQVAVMEGQPQLLLNTGPAGSPAYISPEVFSGQPFSAKADVWAVGCIVWNLFTGLRLYDVPTDASFRFFIQMGGIYKEGLCEVFLQHFMANNGQQHDMYPRLQAVQLLSSVQRDLMRQLLQEDPNNRPTPQEILQHPFFHE